MTENNFFSKSTTTTQPYVVDCYLIFIHPTCPQASMHDLRTVNLLVSKFMKLVVVRSSIVNFPNGPRLKLLLPWLSSLGLDFLEVQGGGSNFDSEIQLGVGEVTQIFMECALHYQKFSWVCICQNMGFYKMNRPLMTAPLSTPFPHPATWKILRLSQIDSVFPVEGWLGEKKTFS